MRKTRLKGSLGMMLVVSLLAPKPVALTCLSAWNGDGGTFPQDQENNLVAQRIREKTGVTLKLESITTSEVKKLNTIFASDTVPDIVNAPF